MNKVKTAVVGVGFLGHYHAEKYANLPQSELIAICDINPERRNEVAQIHQTTPIDNYHDLIGKVDAVSIAVPTPEHYEVAKFFLENGVHVLLEKPITTTIEEAEHLITIAKEKKATNVYFFCLLSKKTIVYQL